MVDLGNSLRRIRAQATGEAWGRFMAEAYPGEDRFVGLVMGFAQAMSDDPAYRNPELAVILMENALRLRATGQSYLHGMAPP